MTSPEALFADRRANDPTGPLLTFYDDASGERAELSATSLGNWVAKTHFLLGDELGLGPGDRAYVALPMHWLQVAVLLGVWSAGLEVVTTPDAADVAFVDAEHVALARAPEVLALALQPWGRGFDGPPPPGTTDYVVAVRPQADAWASVRPPASPGDAALDGSSRSGVVAAARRRAESLGLVRGARVLLEDRAAGSPDVLTLLAVLAVGGSLVLVRHATGDPSASRIAQERVTAFG